MLLSWIWFSKSWRIYVIHPGKFRLETRCKDKWIWWEMIRSYFYTWIEVTNHSRVLREACRSPSQKSTSAAYFHHSPMIHLRSSPVDAYFCMPDIRFLNRSTSSKSWSAPKPHIIHTPAPLFVTFHLNLSLLNIRMTAKPATTYNVLFLWMRLLHRLADSIVIAYYLGVTGSNNGYRPR